MWAGLSWTVLLVSLCSLMSLQSPASQLDDSVLEVGMVVVTGHTPFTTQQANSGLFSPSHSGSRFQEQQESANFHSHALFKRHIWPHHVACRTLVPWPGIKPVSLALEMWSQPLDRQRSSKHFSSFWWHHICQCPVRQSK